LGGTIAVCLAAASTALAAPVDVTEDTVLRRGVVAEINATRAAAGLAVLRPSKPLARAAREHARSMATLGYFSHSWPGGTPTIRSVAASYGKGSGRWAVGEILVWAAGRLSAQAAVARWLASAPHRRDLLGNWRHIGVGAVHASGAPGVYGGRDVTIVAVNFGRRS
jgi:uncharacterized protein YkwD